MDYLLTALFGIMAASLAVFVRQLKRTSRYDPNV